MKKDDAKLDAFESERKHLYKEYWLEILGLLSHSVGLIVVGLLFFYGVPVFKEYFPAASDDISFILVAIILLTYGYVEKLKPLGMMRRILYFLSYFAVPIGAALLLVYGMPAVKEYFPAESKYLEFALISIIALTFGFMISSNNKKNSLGMMLMRRGPVLFFIGCILLLGIMIMFLNSVGYTSKTLLGGVAPLLLVCLELGIAKYIFWRHLRWKSLLSFWK